MAEEEKRELERLEDHLAKERVSSRSFSARRPVEQAEINHVRPLTKYWNVVNFFFLM